VGHAARMTEMRNAYSNLVSKPRMRPPEDLGVYGKIILEWILRK
jgi:hypothetical protein